MLCKAPESLVLPHVAQRQRPILFLLLPKLECALNFDIRIELLTVQFIIIIIIFRGW